MYVDTSSDDEISDEEENHETMPPIQRSQGIVNIHEVLHLPPGNLPEANGKMSGDIMRIDDVETNLSNETNSDDELENKETEKTKEKEATTVTTIVLGVDSHPANQFSSVAVKMNFDAREAMTDEEFPEKLI
uniref:Uncharacterized protein n=1 Tax=Angiostrongylus cantonensis TaxID=6313 RepID=A0A0K0D645_ANGCA